MALTSRAYVRVCGEETEYADKVEAAIASLGILAAESEGTVVELRAKFSDGDAWGHMSMRVGDTVYCKPEAGTRYGLDANAVIRSSGVTFVNEG